jgi:class 3 adenylate cyclase
MICSHCGSKVEDEKRFCGDCGSALAWVCACGGQNPPNKRFCSDCGAPHDARNGRGRQLPAAQEAERRLLTAMFVDLVGSTSLSARLDPEDLRSVIAAFYRCVTEIVGRLDGFVARYMGDGVLVYFGHPQSHEDDPERAIRAGLAIVGAVSNMDTVAGPRGTLRIRVGIATGTVIAGDLVGSGFSLESTIVGETPNLAARLQTTAQPDTVVISQTTQMLAGQLFEYAALEPLSLKGLLEPVTAFTVLRESTIDSRFEALRGRHIPLIGRKEDISLLMDRWKSATTGEGCIVLLSGEAGMGKSRLIAALEERLSDTAHAPIRFLCSPHYQDTPLYPVIRQFERAANFSRGDSEQEKRNKMQRLLASVGSLEDDLALIADLLSISGPDGDLPSTLPPPRKRELTFSAIVRHIVGLTRTTPVLIIVEDIHWSDPSTLELLQQLTDVVEKFPILVVVTARPELHPSWATRPQVTFRVLDGLNRRDAIALIREVSAEGSLPDEVVERILERADNVPLFIEELTKTVLQTGPPRKDVEAFEPQSQDIVPTSLRASLMARLDRSPVGKQLAQIGAVIGREFSFEMLEALSALPRDRIQNALEELINTGITTERGRPPHCVHTFRHALLQDAAYASLLREKRRIIHLGVAEILEKDTGAITREPQLIAWHFAEAAAPDKSIYYYLKAAATATGRFALGEVVSHLKKGLRQLEYLSESPDRRQRELGLRLALGRALIDYRGSGSDEVREAFERAHELSVALDDTEHMLKVHDGLVNYYFGRSEPKKMLTYAEEMFDVAKRTANPQALFMSRRSSGYANLLLGRFREAQTDLQHLITTYKIDRDGPDAALTTRDPKVSACTALGICLTVMGYPDSGTALSLEGLNHAEKLNHVVSLILGLRRACVQRMILNDPRGVVELSDRLFGLSSEYQTFKGAHDGTLFRCWAYLHTQKEPSLLERMQACIEQLHSTRHWALLPFFMTSTAELIGSYGDRAGAIILLDRAAELVKVTGEQWCEAEILRLQARFKASNRDEAVALLQLSIAKSKEQHAKQWELRAATSLADIWCEQSRCVAARDGLRPLYMSFTEGADTPDLIAARKLLERLKEHIE